MIKHAGNSLKVVKVLVKRLKHVEKCLKRFQKLFNQFLKCPYLTKQYVYCCLIHFFVKYMIIVTNLEK